MLAWTWGKWPDVLVDFGRELYIPWQISEGKVLYRDIAYVQGPLSPYINALWFSVLGVSVHTLMLANLVILAAILILLYRLLAAIGTRFAATMACIIFLGLFAFAQFGSIGNFNYICPYRHEVTHAMLLALAILNCLEVYMRRPRRWLIVAAGGCFGLLALTKGEFFAAVLIALVITAALAAWIHSAGRREILPMLVLFGVAAAIPLMICLGLFALAMPANLALRGMLGSWPATFHDAFRLSPFVQSGLGTGDVSANLKLIFQWAFHYLTLFGAATAATLALRTPGWIRPAASAGLAVLLLAKERVSLIHWSEAVRPLPLLMLVFAIVALGRLIYRRNDVAAVRRLLPSLAFIVFAGMLLGKMALNARIHHYGFVLAMPASMLLVMALLGWIPCWIEEKGGFGWAFRSVALAALLALTHWYLNVEKVRLRSRDVIVAKGADSFGADERGRAVNEVLAHLHEAAAAGDTLLVLPEGVMLNFLSRHANPLPYVDFVPTEFFYFGEERIMASIQAHPPDWIALVHDDTSEFGFRFFGQDYGQQLAEWVQRNYRQSAMAGSHPFVDEQFGIILLRKGP